jgi:hypothetical protein
MLKISKALSSHLALGPEFGFGAFASRYGSACEKLPHLSHVLLKLKENEIKNQNEYLLLSSDSYKNV